ncbi:hypothetical protein [Methylobacterium aquaticum]|uniref:hypothetical protein n=1 Tax=Methylobacterium aquaticum TaxID=270351 RepID=UPI00193176E7|nr:hypothetical protein [Methylobacterium aquaticum]QRE75342.1 hypothetical protein F1D61_18655 [Methylobacterium aquaticum]
MGPTDNRLRCLDDRLGEAALDPSRWGAVLTEVSTLIGGDGAMLLQSHRRTPGVPCTPEVDALVADYFGQGWHVKDLRTRAVPRVMRGEVVTDHDILTPEEMARAPFYNELLRPHGYHWFAVAGFRAGPEYWGVSVQRRTRSGPFEAAQVRPLAGLMGRLGQAAALSEALGRAALDGTLRGLDQVAQAALALDGAGRVIGANPRAEALFDAAFRVADGDLRIADPRAREEVAALVAALRPGRTPPPARSWWRGATVVPWCCAPWAWQRASARRSWAPARSCSSPISRPSGGPIRPCSRRSSASPRRRRGSRRSSPAGPPWTRPPTGSASRSRPCAARSRRCSPRPAPAARVRWWRSWARRASDDLGF